MTEPTHAASAVLRFDEDTTKRLALIALATDLTSERDYARHLSGSGIETFVNRIAFTNPVTPESLSAMAPLLGEAASLILPGERLDAIAFSCTAASVLIGDDAVEAAIWSAGRKVPVITPPLAVRHALNELGAQRISMLTPYSPAVSASFAGYFEDHGFDVDRLTALDIADDTEMARLSLASIIEAAVEADAPKSQALFISCTALRSIEVVDAIEERIGKPVVTSNQAAIWAAARACGTASAPLSAGRLMRRHDRAANAHAGA
ncbi:aspartate/glutamate racemase family protein [Fulvimarina sp. MAC3]|uniref:maleate cis-trans isomerase family protein n=1 Tax=Fulvimarina sp. MAC3 TaxID=3148887 RepID=UPI0031FC8794